MDNLVAFPSHSNGNDVDEIFFIIITNIITLLLRKILDPDFSVQSINKIYIYKFQGFNFPGFHESQLYDGLWSFASAMTGDGKEKAGWILHRLHRVKSLGLLNQHFTSDFRNHVAENRLSEVKLQLLSSHLSASALEIMLQKIYGLNVSNYQVTISLLMPETKLQKICFQRNACLREYQQMQMVYRSDTSHPLQSINSKGENDFFDHEILR